MVGCWPCRHHHLKQLQPAAITVRDRDQFGKVMFSNKRFWCTSEMWPENILLFCAEMAVKGFSNAPSDPHHDSRVQKLHATSILLIVVVLSFPLTTPESRELRPCTAVFRLIEADSSLSRN